MDLSQSKVLFLDIDGVLNNETTKEKFEEGPFKYFTALDKKLLKLFLDWLEDKDIKIVISSAWRNHEDALEFLKKSGIDWFDKTENYGKRPYEIFRYCVDNNVVEMAILDDNDFGWHDKQRERFVQTSYIHGLRKKNLKKLEKILEV